MWWYHRIIGNSPSKKTSANNLFIENVEALTDSEGGQEAVVDLGRGPSVAF